MTIVGYGSQGHAHAQNLNDSGVKVTVGLRKGGASWDKAKKAGLKVAEVANAVKGADFVMMLMPDEHIGAVYREEVEPNIRKGATLAFAHGLQHPLRAGPAAQRHRCRHDRTQGAGHTVRSTYVQGGGTPIADSDPSGRKPQGARSRAFVRCGDRRRARGRDRDVVQGGDRDRPVRRASGALRRMR